VILDEAGNEHHIRLFPGMSVEGLRAKINESGADAMEEAYLQCGASDFEHFKSLFSQLYPSAEIVEDATIEAGTHRLAGRVRFQFTIEYFQAIAKIAFHYYLVRSRRGYRGDEPAFAAIRSFIKNGGDKDEFFHDSGQRFAVPFGQKVSGCMVSPPNWCHVFAADETKEAVLVYMLLFAGPGSVPPPYEVTLGRIDDQIVLPNGVWGHVFRYDASSTGQYAGVVEEATLTRLDYSQSAGMGPTLET
jgi:hypothetical protein